MARTFPSNYAIDLDKNGVKNNDCRHGWESVGLFVISLTLIFRPDGNEGGQQTGSTSFNWDLAGLSPIFANPNLAPVDAAYSKLRSYINWSSVQVSEGR